MSPQEGQPLGRTATLGQTFWNMKILSFDLNKIMTKVMSTANIILYDSGVVGAKPSHTGQTDCVIS